jgi:hypothetical protein
MHFLFYVPNQSSLERVLDIADVWFVLFTIVFDLVLPLRKSKKYITIFLSVRLKYFESIK